MNGTRATRLLVALAAAALLAVLAGCGSDSSGQDSTTTPTEVSIPSPTSPLPTTTTTTSTANGGGGGNKKPAQTTNTTGGSAPPCSVPVAYQDFKYTGIDCSAALAVATAWDRNGNTCNTVDNPESPIGPQRTCSVEGFTCSAKRDMYSDARFVTCTQGGQIVRFTWLPA